MKNRKVVTSELPKNANDNWAVADKSLHQAGRELTESEAADELRISIDTLQRERAAGKIAYAQRRRRILYPMSCIDDYRQSQVTRECTIFGSKEKDQLATGMSSTAMDDRRRAARWARQIKS